MNDEVKPNLELITLFSTPVIKTNIGREFTKDELQLFNTDIRISTESEKERFKEQYNINNKDASINFPTNTKHHQSKSFNIFDTFAKELKDIKTFCEHELKRYLEDIEGVNTDIVNICITQSWLNKIDPQGYRNMHNHKNSYLSGVLYIRCLPNDFINFSNLDRMYDTTLQLPKRKITPFTAEGASVNVKEGDFVVFPSHTLHAVGMNKTKYEQRISISFDTWPTHIPSLYPPFK